MPTQLHGINDLITRLEKIAEECGEKPPEAKQRDEFLRTKQRIYTLLEQAREDIRNRNETLKKRGCCYETIQKGHSVRQNLDELKKLLLKLQELHKRAQGKRGASKRREELQARYSDIRVLKRHVEEVNDLFATSGQVAEKASSSAPAANLLGLRDAGRAPAASDEDSRRLVTDDEQEALKRMKQRDEELDKAVDAIGVVVERLDPLARQIGKTAEAQRVKAQAITEEVTTANQGLGELNKKAAEVLRYEKNTTCVCQLVLLIVLLACIGFVFQQVGM